MEIRLQPEPAPDADALKSLADAFKKQFPKQAPMQLLQVGIAASGQQQGAPLSQIFSQANIGFRLANSNDSRVLQLRNDGFAYSHLAPYTQWEIFRSEAQPLWTQYRRSRPQSKLTRCALRYINRIDIPGTKIEIHDYFALYPKIPEGLPQQDVVSTALNVQMPQLDMNCMAVINQALVEPVKLGHLSFILDIDVFRLGIESWQDSEMWDFMEKLRTRKNEIFEACITQSTRELIDRCAYSDAR
jgi:uncharacterized protein (TIGR04255 family)